MYLKLVILALVLGFQSLYAQTFKADPTASMVKWKGSKKSGTHDGTVKIKSGSLIMKDGKLTGGDFTIDMKTIEVADLQGEWKGKLEGHLKAADFFDVDKNPEAMLKITSVKPAGADYAVEGNLTIKGISNKVSFTTKVDNSDASKAKADAKISINRKLWKIEYAGKPDDSIKDEITFEVHIESAK